jgi:hypothetical protein
MKLKIFLITLILVINKAHGEEVLYLLQSVADTSKVELITDISNQNILYINQKCEKCFENAIKLSKKSKKNFIVIVGKKPIDNIFEILKLYKISKENWYPFYSDTGLRYTNQLKILDNTSVFISQRKGQTKMNFNINLARSIPEDTDLEIWN